MAKKGTKKKGKGKQDKLNKISKDIDAAIEEWRKLRDDTPCYPLLIGPPSIRNDLVDDIFSELLANYSNTEGRLDVIVQSGGGDIDAAYNVAQLLRRYGHKHLEFIVPRWAKSAATMLVCAGDRILMTPIAELGPLDPQITEINPLEARLETFSPLHIGSAIDLIRDEYQNGNEKLAEGLLKRLQYPITLGGFRSSVNIGKEYVTKLLSSRMLKGKKEKKIEEIAVKLTSGYADHGYCIDVEETKSLGLTAEELSGDQLDIVWKIHQLAKQRRELEQEEREREVVDKLKDLPPEIRDKLPELLEQQRP